MTYRFRIISNFTIGIALTAILLYIAFRGTNFSRLWMIIQTVNMWWVLLACPLLLLSHYIRAWRWQLLLVPVKDRVRRTNAFSSLIIGYMANNILPRAGEIVRPYTLGKVEQVSKASSFGSVFLERMIDLISLLIGIAVLLVLFQRAITDQFVWWNTLSMLAIGLTLVFILSIGMLLYKRNLILRFIKIFLFPFSSRIRERGEEIFHSFVDGMLIIRKRNNMWTIVALTIVMWILYVYTAYLPLHAFDLGDASVNLLTGFVLTIVTSLSVLVPTPGATGSYHTFVVETLTRLYGIQREVALGYATLTHAVGYFSVIVVGLIYLLRYNFRVRDVLRQVESTDDREGMQQSDPSLSHPKK